MTLRWVYNCGMRRRQAAIHTLIHVHAGFCADTATGMMLRQPGVPQGCKMYMA